MPAHGAVKSCKKLQAKWGGTATMTKAFREDMILAGGSAEVATSAEFAAGCGTVVDLMTAGTIRHGNQSALNDAVKAAKWRGGTERSFLLAGCPEVGPLAAVVRALHGLTHGSAEVWAFRS